MAEGSFFQRLKQGLTKSRETWVQKIGAILQNRQWDEQSLDAMEESLITADVGVKATQKLMNALRRQSPNGSEDVGQEMAARLQTAMIGILEGSALTPKIAPLPVKPWVILFLGVNGVGKTTTIGKLAAQYRAAGKKTLLVAGDTFRAAAVEQLDIWGQRVGVDVIKHKAGSDPSAVVFDGIQAAKSRGIDILLIDTAGRLHTKVHLIEELKKIRRIIAREQPGAPQETLLVLDATTGQNGLQQARVFKEATD
ncbi:MAG: signal recognition particle-docking protein FtsY, partial [Candidatus Binatia bacterium]